MRGLTSCTILKKRKSFSFNQHTQWHGQHIPQQNHTQSTTSDGFHGLVSFCWNSVPFTNLLRFIWVRVKSSNQSFGQTKISQKPCWKVGILVWLQQSAGDYEPTTAVKCLGDWALNSFNKWPIRCKVFDKKGEKTESDVVEEGQRVNVYQSPTVREQVTGNKEVSATLFLRACKRLITSLGKMLPNCQNMAEKMSVNAADYGFNLQNTITTAKRSHSSNVKFSWCYCVWICTGKLSPCRQWVGSVNLSLNTKGKWKQILLNVLWSI